MFVWEKIVKLDFDLRVVLVKIDLYTYLYYILYLYLYLFILYYIYIIFRPLYLFMFILIMAQFPDNNAILASENKKPDEETSSTKCRSKFRIEHKHVLLGSGGANITFRSISQMRKESFPPTSTGAIQSKITHDVKIASDVETPVNPFGAENNNGLVQPQQHYKERALSALQLLGMIDQSIFRILFLFMIRLMRCSAFYLSVLWVFLGCSTCSWCVPSFRNDGSLNLQKISAFMTKQG